MKLKYIGKEPKQDKKNGKWYLTNNEYDFTEERAKELIDTKLFVVVSEEAKKNKSVKKDAE